MGIFFDDNKPKVTDDEWRKQVRYALSGRGLNEREINFVEMIFYGDFHEKRYEDKGLQADEIERGIKMLKEKRNLHTLTDKQISIVEEELMKKL